MTRLGIRTRNIAYPGLRQRIADLQSEIDLFADECRPMSTMDGAAIVEHMKKIDRRVATIRLGVHVVRYEAKNIARAESRRAAATAVQA